MTAFEPLDLKIGDRIAVSFSSCDADEAVGMINALFEQKVIVKAIAELPLQQNNDAKTIEYKIKTVDAFTDSSSSDDEKKPSKRRK